jgi:creatinine amidohydrolase
MRPYILLESNWQAIKEQQIDLAILPWGATEAHNYHLPYGTDVYEADHITAEAAKIAWGNNHKVMILPTIPFGVNTGQHDIRLDMNMSPSTQLAVLSDVVEVLDRQGIQKLLIVNSHGGNDFKTMLRELGLEYPNMFLATCNWFQALDRTAFFEAPGDHADEMETSLLMYLKPELVLPLDQAGDGKEKKSRISGIREGWAWSERRWSEVTADTGVGNPKAATAIKGENYFKAITEKLAGLFAEICQTDMDNLYTD